MGRRGGKNDNNDVKEVVNDFIDLMLDDIRNELRDILTELEIYQRTWVVPWFVQKFLSDLHIRLSLLLDKLGRSM
jgi:hypothetical protein